MVCALRSYKKSDHPSEIECAQLGRELGLETKQVRSWFQNHRTQIKVWVMDWISDLLHSFLFFHFLDLVSSIRDAINGLESL